VKSRAEVKTSPNAAPKAEVMKPQPEVEVVPVVEVTVAPKIEPQSDNSVEQLETKAPELIKAAPKKKVAPKKKAAVKTSPMDRVVVKKAPSKKTPVGGRRGIRLKDDSDT
jgi:hypothetical protein